MNPLISALITHGRNLAFLLEKATHKSKLGKINELNDVHDNVKNYITELLKTFDDVTVSKDVDAKTMNNVLQKVQDTLQKFAQLDKVQASFYADLQNEVERLRRDKFSFGHDPTGKPSQHSSPSFSLNPEDVVDFEDAFNNLAPYELKQCLTCVGMAAGLLSSLSTTKGIKKRDLINWWIGMEIIANPIQGEQVLGKLVDEGFIDRVIQNKTILNRYTMRPSIIERLKQKTNINVDANNVQDQENNTWFINRNMSNLNAEMLERISKMKNTKVLNLGINRATTLDFDDRLIEVESVKKLESTLGNLRNVRCLSLEGVLRIVSLPREIFKLINLKVLDLKACHDLSIIPIGAHRLSSLTYLDLSMCYMLDDTPLGVSMLKNLVILKGFVISEKYFTDSELSDLTQLDHLSKLSIRTRRMDFPNQKDMEELQKMHQLTNLKIVWIRRSLNVSTKKVRYTNDVVLPTKLKKIEIERAPATIASQMLELISKKNGLEKVYIKGGRLCEFGPGKAIKFDYVKFLRLRYLPNLHINWSDFRATFPKLDRLEIFECRNLIFFPCDQFGIWECLE